MEVVVSQIFPIAQKRLKAVLLPVQAFTDPFESAPEMLADEFAALGTWREPGYPAEMTGNVKEKDSGFHRK